jgi:hypothetical protein
MLNCRNFACSLVFIFLIIFITFIILHIQYSDNNYLEISLYALAFAFLTYVLKTECKKEHTQVSTV